MPTNAELNTKINNIQLAQRVQLLVFNFNVTEYKFLMLAAEVLAELQ
jgi:hypothetical protein